MLALSRGPGWSYALNTVEHLHHRALAAKPPRWLILLIPLAGICDIFRYTLAQAYLPVACAHSIRSFFMKKVDPKSKWCAIEYTVSAAVLRTVRLIESIIYSVFLAPLYLMNPALAYSLSQEKRVDEFLCERKGFRTFVKSHDKLVMQSRQREELYMQRERAFEQETARLRMEFEQEAAHLRIEKDTILDRMSVWIQQHESVTTALNKAEQSHKKILKAWHTEKDELISELDAALKKHESLVASLDQTRNAYQEALTAWNLEKEGLLLKIAQLEALKQSE